MMRQRYLALIALITWSCSSFLQSVTLHHLSADEPIQSSSFEAVRAILKDRCFACHGTLKQEASLRLDTAKSTLRGGDSGPAAIPKNPIDSLILQRITSTDLSTRMPPEGHPLSESQINLISAWIDQGALPPPQDEPEPTPDSHWAFQPIRSPAIPSTITLPSATETTTDYQPNPIDQFLLSQLASQQLQPRPPADKPTRLRRLYLDLIGLPPTPQQLDEFLADSSPDAYEKTALRLLASPQYGERWARHWMDVWRYADWFGRRYVPDVWNSAPQIWRWRDWIVHSLNEDKGYDQMIQEMLAADEVAPHNPDASVATGFLIRNWYALNPNDWMRSNVEHTSKAFLGLTFHCAHCHDHKYDPISQEDYFRFRSFFEPIGIRQDRMPGEPDPGPFQEYEYSTLRKVQRLGSVRIFDKTPNAPTWFYTGGDERNRLADKSPIQPGVPSFLKSFYASPTESELLPPVAWYPGLRPDIRATIRSELDTKVAQARQTLTQLEQSSNNQTTDPSIADFQAQLAAKEMELRDLQQEDPDQQRSPLEGKQSLLLNAITGRRMIYRPLPELTSITTNTIVRFDVAILADAHFNFQLTRNSDQGLTATFVGFENGTIRTYEPHSFTEVNVASFDRSSGNNRFRVEMKIDLEKDQAHLTLHSLIDNQVLVDNRVVALNGWNPIGDPTKGILFDARPGSLAAIDNLVIHVPIDNKQPSEPTFKVDFEVPNFTDQAELVGLAHWKTSSYSVAPATSTICTELPSPKSLQLQASIDSLRIRAHLPQNKITAAQQQLASAEAELAALEARMAADDAKYINHSPTDLIQELSQHARALELQATLLKSQYAKTQAEVDLAIAESLPEADTARKANIDKALAALQSARNASHSAEAEINKPVTTEYQPLTPIHPSTTTGRRKALANWITHKDNPLTARVAINHIWLRHFHSPLVPTVFDFGRNGTPPRHPELLDWLANELIQSNWSMKRIHYLIVTSEAYQRESSQGNHPATEKDPENRLYWRMNTGRMEAEVLRDSILNLAGKLERQLGGQELENNTVFTTFRRSLYYCCQPEDDGKSPLSMLFDGPDPTDCYRRTRTVIPQQALALTNSSLVHEIAPLIRSTLTQQSNNSTLGESDITTVHSLFKLILSRQPSPAEAELCLSYIQNKDNQTNSEPTREKRLDSLIRILLNHNDFITIR